MKLTTPDTLLPLKQAVTSMLHPGEGQSNIVAVVARETHLTLYVNGQVIDEVSDGTFGSGQIGVIAYRLSASQPTEVAYSDAKLWQL